MYVDPRRPEPRTRPAEHGAKHGAERGAARAGRRIAAALQKMVDHCAELLAMAERPWASATFSGAHHTVTLRFNGTDDCDTADRFIEGLPEHEFGLPGLLVADAQVRAVTYDSLPTPTMTVEVELLVLNED